MNRPTVMPPALFRLSARVVLGNAAMPDHIDALDAITEVLAHVGEGGLPPESHAQPLQDANGNTVGHIRFEVLR